MVQTTWKCASCEGTHGTMVFAKHELMDEYVLLCLDCMDYYAVSVWHDNYVELPDTIRHTPFTPAELDPKPIELPF